MDAFISPPSPELSLEHIQQLAPYAKVLGKASASALARTLTGNLLTKKKGHGLDLREVRPYNMSDEVRHIDWRVTARTGSPHTRVYTEDVEHRTFIIMHLSQDAYFGTQTTFLSSRYAQLAALISWRSQFQREPVGALLHYGQQQYARQTITDWHDWGQHLADCTALAQRDASPSPFALSDLPLLRSQSVLILSDQIWLNPALRAHLMDLSKHNRVYWVSLEDPNLFALPDGQYRFANQGNSASQSVNSSSRQQAQQRFQTQQLHFTQQLNSMGVLRLQFDVNESPIAIARTLLAQGVIH